MRPTPEVDEEGRSADSSPPHEQGRSATLLVRYNGRIAAMYLTTRTRAFRVGPEKHLVCNAITGSIVVVSDAGLRLLEELRHGELDSCDSESLQRLKEEKLLFASQEEEETYFLGVCRRAWQDFRRHAPRSYTFIVNTHCNFDCPYCFEQEAFRARASSLSHEQIEAAFRIVDRHAAKQAQVQAPTFEIFGGEPLLPGSRPTLDEIMERISVRGYKASLQTNGYFLADNVDFFVRHRDHVALVQVTLDGPRNVHDRRRVPRSGQPTFDKIVSGIEALAREDLPIHMSIRMNVDRDNVDFLEEMAEIYARQGWSADSRFSFTAAPVDNRSASLKDTVGLLTWLELFERVLPLSTDVRGGPFDISVFKIIGHFRYYLSTVRQHKQGQPTFVPRVVYCEAAGLKHLSFHPDGRLYPCPETVGMTELAIGTYHPTFALDRHMAKRWHHQTILHRAQCRACEISTFCGGGCILAALTQNGDASSPACEGAPELLAAYLRQIRTAGA